jgi:hypothetical protein
MQRLFHEIHRLIEKHHNKPYVEIEVRFGWKQDTYFDTNIRYEFYQNIHQHLNSPIFNTLEEESEVYMWKNIRIVKVNGTVVSTHRKRRIEHVDLALKGTPYDVRLSVCQELPASIDKQQLHRAIMIRKRTRTSFRYKMWSYDLTKVYIPNSDERVFEFEIELMSRKVSSSMSVNYLAYSLAMKIVDVSLFASSKCDTPVLEDVYRV